MFINNENFVTLKDPGEECLFCFDIVDNKKSFVNCSTCYKKCHKKCYDEWFKRKKERNCISCQQCTLVYSKRSLISRCIRALFYKTASQRTAPTHT